MPKNYYQTDMADTLQYDGKNTPKVTAKGASGISAEEMLRVAEQNNIPLQTDPELSRILAQIPLGDEIPRELYLAIAEVIAFAYGLSSKISDPTLDHEL
jgi:flagellar biosynthesis protein